MDIMASIGLIATIMTFVGIAAYIVDKLHHKPADAGIKNMARAIGVARPGDVVFIEVPLALSDETHRRFTAALEAMDTGVRFVVLCDGVRVARVENDEP
jgi:hypothetical protein